MKFYASDYAPKDFYVDKTEAINDTLENVPLSVRTDILFGGNMCLDKEKIYDFIFNQDVFEIAKEVEYYEGWLKELIIDETVTEYDTNYLEDVMDSYEGCEKKLEELRKIGIYAYANETAESEYNKIVNDEVSHTRYNDLDVYITLDHDQVIIEVNNGEKVVEAASCGVSKDDIVDTICYLFDF